MWSMWIQDCSEWSVSMSGGGESELEEELKPNGICDHSRKCERALCRLTGYGAGSFKLNKCLSM